MPKTKRSGTRSDRRKEHRSFPVRALAGLLSLFLLLGAFSLTSCGQKAALEDDGLKISEAVYRYWLASFKTRFINNYSDIEDTEECWNRVSDDGSTVGEYVEQYTLNYAKNALCALRLFRDRRLTLSDSVKEEIEEAIDEVIDYQYDGETSAFNAALHDTYGMDVDDLREAYEIDAKIDRLKEDLFGENGSMKVDEAALNAYYEEKYFLIQVIYVNTAYKYVTDEEGNRLTDPATGYYQTVELSEEEKAEKEKKAEEAYGRILAGEEFADVMTAYSDLTLDSTYKEGIYFPSDDYTILVGAGFSTSAYQKIVQMQVNDVLQLTGEEVNPASPGRYFVKRCELKEKGYREKDGTLGTQFADLAERVQNEKFNALLGEELENVEVNEEFVSSLHVADVKKGFSFLTGYEQ